jgi:hypothetical protein
VLLVGLGLNAAVGWFWADPIAALVIAAAAGKAGRAAWHGDTCCAPAVSVPASAARVTATDSGCADGCCAAADPGTAERR